MFNAVLVTREGADEQIIEVSVGDSVVHRFPIERARALLLEDAADYNLKQAVAAALPVVEQEIAPDAERSE